MASLRERVRRTSLSVCGIEDDMFMGTSPGFGGTIKCRTTDFVVNEIDMSGRLVEASSFEVPPPPAMPPPVQPATASSAPAESSPTNSADAGASGHGWSKEEDKLKSGWFEQLRRCFGVSESELARLAKLDAAARGPIRAESQALGPAPTSTQLASATISPGARARDAALAVGRSSGCEAGFEDDTAGGLAMAEQEEGEVDCVVRIPVGQGADKEARARVHRAVQETFPFIKTATEKDADGAVTVVCTQNTPSPALLRLLSGSDLEALQRMVNRGPTGVEAAEGLTLAAEQDRARRTLVHRAIAEAFPYLQTKTHKDPGEPNSQQVSVHWSKRKIGGRGGKKRKRQGSDDGVLGAPRKDGGANGAGDRWVRFGLRKEGREHHQTAVALSKAFRVPLSSLSFGGIKDKMAVTTQACVIKGVPPGKILETNGTIPGVTIGNLLYCAGALSLGELSGNKFSIVVRGAKAPMASVQSSVDEAYRTGFINFFGTQRVGSPSAAALGQPLPYQIGRDVLCGDWKAAVTKILCPRDGDPPFLHSALSDLLEGRITPKECAARVKGSNRLSVERSVLHGLVRYGASAYQAAIQCVPYGMRTMWVHAYQSHVWNSLACARIRCLGAGAVPGDLLVQDDKHEISGATSASASGAAEDVGEAPLLPPADQAAGVDGGGPLAGVGGGTASGDGTSETATTGSNKFAIDRGGKGAIRVLTREMMDAFASRGVTPLQLMRRVVLPLVGTSVEYPQHVVRKMYQNRLERDGIPFSLMWPNVGAAPGPGEVSSPPSEAQSLPPVDRDTGMGSVTVSRESPSGGQSESPGSGHCKGGGSWDDISAGNIFPTAASAASCSSALVPRGAYRRLLCVPADVSWEAAMPWASVERRAGKSLATSLSAPPSPSKMAPVAVYSTASGLGRSGGGDDHGSGGGEDGDPFSRNEWDGVVEQERAAGVSSDELPLVGDVRLTFTLPPGSFATMFLREVMKRNDDIVSGVRAGGQQGDRAYVDTISTGDG